MGLHTNKLWALAESAFNNQQIIDLQKVVTIQQPYPEPLSTFDLTLGGPSVTRLSCNHGGRYNPLDREIFRPLQYCFMSFEKGYRDRDLQWYTRHVVQFSSLHVEALVKKIGRVPYAPLGRALRSKIAQRKIGRALWTDIGDFTDVYNDAKHNFGHPKDTHMFSVEDAVLAYFISRKFGLVLYPIAHIRTNLTVFDRPC